MTGANNENSPLTGINNVGTHTFNVGVTSVVYKVYDAAGNSASCSYTVTVNDVQNPTIACTSNYVVNNNTGNCSATINTSNPVIADNCGVTKLIWTMTGCLLYTSDAADE